MTETDYLYDVFFSYKRSPEIRDWTRRVHSKLKFWVGQRMDREPKFFFDEDALELGSTWPDELRRGLGVSRCMVSVLSPSYFRSDWCLAEWGTFLARKKITGKDLIFPMCFADGEHFPRDAYEIQHLDVREYAYTVPSFWDTPRAVDLEDKLKNLAGKLAHFISTAPEFRADWPVQPAERLPDEPIHLPIL